MNKFYILSAAACIAASSIGCDKLTGGGAATASATTTAAPTATGPAKKVGLENPDNNAAVVKAVKQLLADCGATMDEKEDGKSKSLSSCDKYAAFRDTKDLEKMDATCINIMEDANVKNRAAGLACLAHFGGEYKSDKALAGRVVDLLAKEKAPSPIDMQFSNAVAEIFELAEVSGKVKALATKADAALDVKQGLLAGVRDDWMYDLVKSASADPKLANAAVKGFGNYFDKHTEEACAYWVSQLESSDSDTSRHAIGHLTGGWTGNTSTDSESDWYVSGGGGGPTSSGDKRCSPTQLDTAVKTGDKIFKTGKLEGSYWAYSLGFLVKDKKSPASVKKDAIALLAAIAGNDESPLRQSALYAFDISDPAQRAIVAKFLKHPTLGSHAASILKKK
jgi:hypothetical protein